MQKKKTMAEAEEKLVDQLVEALRGGRAMRGSVVTTLLERLSARAWRALRWRER